MTSAPTAPPIVDVEGTTRTGNDDVRWIHGIPAGTRDAGEPIQVHAWAHDTFVLRQSKAVHFEGPFLYLFLGNQRALLLDTGATADADRFPLRATVDGIIGRWLEAHPADRYALTVAHSHGHGDHIAGDGQFVGRPDTTIVGTSVEDVTAFFGLTDWPAGTAEFDLGGRVLTVMGCPGHHEASIAVHDPKTGILATGDTVYPGRLYISDLPAFRASLERLLAYAEAHEVGDVLGGHIEMTSEPGRDYPIGAVYQPNEPPLQMTVDQLRAVRDAAASAPDRAGVHVYDDFILFVGNGGRSMGAYIVRSMWHRLTRAVAGIVPGQH